MDKINKELPYITIQLDRNNKIQIEAHNYSGNGNSCQGLDATAELEELFAPGERTFKEDEGDSSPFLEIENQENNQNQLSL